MIPAASRAWFDLMSHNRSSGKMGYTLAEAAVARGARVVLVSGTVHQPVPRGVELVRVRRSRQRNPTAVVGQRL